MAKAHRLWESLTAKLLGGERSVLSRGVDVNIFVNSIRLGVSCKYGKFGIRKKDIQEIQELCEKNGIDIWGLATKERGGKYQLITLDINDFAKILDLARRSRPHD